MMHNVQINSQLNILEIHELYFETVPIIKFIWLLFFLVFLLFILKYSFLFCSPVFLGYIV